MNSNEMVAYLGAFILSFAIHQLVHLIVEARAEAKAKEINTDVFKTYKHSRKPKKDDDENDLRN